MESVEWGEYKISDLFESSNGDVDIQKRHINHKGTYVITAGLFNNGVLGKTDVPAHVFGENTITIDMFGSAFYRPYKYKMVTHARVFSLKPLFPISRRTGIFIVNSFRFLSSEFGYNNMCSWEKVKYKAIKLPTKDGQIDFAFMESFIAELEAQQSAKLEAYLSAAGLKDTRLSLEEEQMLQQYPMFRWDTFSLEELFGKSTRGKRLKSADRISGNLPFVTAGETDEGISDFIGNDVQVFPKNTTTIDMFGSAKYRNYNYGGDDHIAVVHTEDLPMKAALFVTAAIHKVSHNGQFSYGRNFYAKDADNLSISLPATASGTPDYETMEILISAVQKLVIKDVVKYSDKKMEATKTVIGG